MLTVNKTALEKTAKAMKGKVSSERDHFTWFQATYEQAAEAKLTLEKIGGVKEHEPKAVPFGLMSETKEPGQTKTLMVQSWPVRGHADVLKVMIVNEELLPILPADLKTVAGNAVQKKGERLDFTSFGMIRNAQVRYNVVQ